MAKKSKDKLVKIDEAVYNALKDYVEEHRFDNPSMKNFVEKAIMQSIGFKMYDIEGISKTYDEKAPLEEVVGGTGKGFTMCVVCGKAFFKTSNAGGEISSICPNCRNTITHFAPKLIKQSNPPKEEVKPKKPWHKISSKEK